LLLFPSVLPGKVKLE
jgi:hypothetical protein